MYWVLFCYTVFFASLPALIQFTIIETIAGNTTGLAARHCRLIRFSAASLEKKDAIRAYQALFDYIHNYSRHAYKYLVGWWALHEWDTANMGETDQSHQAARSRGTSIEPDREQKVHSHTSDRAVPQAMQTAHCIDGFRHTSRSEIDRRKAVHIYTL